MTTSWARIASSVVTGAALLCLGAAPATTGKAEAKSCRDQTPRRLEHYDATAAVSRVRPGKDLGIVYTIPGVGPEIALQRCGLHYHSPIENVQPACGGQAGFGAGSTTASAPRPGDWVEIHAVYASKLSSAKCDAESLACCQAGPFVVMAYHAKVVAGGGQEPVPVKWGPPSAEWSGSTTSPDQEPGECKPAAQWVFALGCDYTVSQGQLSLFKHAEPARALQPQERLSHDLTRVGAAP